MRDRRPTVVPPGVKRRRVRPPAGTRHPLPGLFGLLVFAMLGGFFGWVSADPAWLAIGHGRQATATVAECTGQGIGRKCMATLAGPALPAAAVRVVGAQVKTGQRVPVQVVNASSTVAYAGPGGALVLRAVLGLVLVLACGAGTAWATGAARLPYRVLTVPASAAVPLLLALGLLAAAF